MRKYKLTGDNIDTVIGNVRLASETNSRNETSVRNILEDVRKEGDSAIIQYTLKYDNFRLHKKSIRVSRREIAQAHKKVSKAQILALLTLKKNIENVEGRTLKRLHWRSKANDMDIEQIAVPIQSVGCYVPGGEASYPSTLLMTAVPAKIAGVQRIVVTTPPKKLTPLLLVAADLAGVSEIYRIGGVQAIAALAYGTGTIRPVEKIVGPGNSYVTTAKILVSNRVGIDMPAGPTESIIYADKEVDPKRIALDLIAQAEHSFDAVCGLITLSTELACAVEKELSDLMNSVERNDIITKSLNEKGFIILVSSVDQVSDFVNKFAPEHLEIISDNPNQIMRYINNVGVIIINAPCVITDYYAGVNHVLPTGGYAKMRSGLTALDYVKIMRTVKASNPSIIRAFPTIKAFAASEGLPNHMKAIEYMIDKSE